MTRKNYKVLATALAEIGAESDKHAEIIAQAVARVADVLLEDNPRFNRDTFYSFYMVQMYNFRALQNA